MQLLSKIKGAMERTPYRASGHYHQAREGKNSAAPLIAIAALWTAIWVVWQASLLYENHGYRVTHTPGNRFDYSAFSLSPDNSLGLLYFVLAFISLHIAFIGINVSAFQTLISARLPALQTRLIAFASQLLLVTLTLSLSNAWHYSQSLSGDIFTVALLRHSGIAIHRVLSTLMTLYFCIWIAYKVFTSRAWRLTALGACVIWAGFYAKDLSNDRHRKSSVSTHSKPNVVMIGMDSLRTDHLKYFGAPFSVTPNLDSILKDSVVYTDTLTTQPHTFPATVSILTGQWPTHNKARGNLFPPNIINTRASIAHTFRAAGYQTLIGMDETRFANIDERYGFDKIVGPRMGIMDFTMSVTADNVLVNLISSTWLAKIAFPDIYGNRAIDYVYNPNSFSTLVDHALESANVAQPLFIYVHLCAGHWPYRSASLFRGDRFPELRKGAYGDTSHNYLRALDEADSQLGHLMSTLQRLRILDDTVLVTFSDHGEDFGMVKDKVLNDLGEPSTQSVYGHGGSAYRAPQNKVLFAIRKYGINPLTPRPIDTPASLVDVAPTVLQMANLSASPHVFDGTSLAGMARGEDASNPAQRLRYVESSFFPAALNKKQIDPGEVVDQTAQMYEFMPSGRIQVRDDYISFQISNRQRAAYQGQWIVATSEHNDATPIVLNQAMKKWWPLASAPIDSPAQPLLDALCDHWKEDHAIDSTCGRSRK